MQVIVVIKNEQSLKTSLALAVKFGTRAPYHFSPSNFNKRRS